MKKKSVKILAAIPAFLIMCISPLAAQDVHELEFRNPQSLVNEASGGIIKSDADEYLNVNDFSGTDFESFFSFVKAMGGGVEGGASFNIGNHSLGFYYAGNFAAGSSSRDFDGNWEQDNAAAGTEPFTWNNYIGILFGNGKIGGFRFDINIDDVRNDKAIWETSAAIYDAEYYSRGNILYALSWGKNFVLGEGLLKPAITVAYNADLYKDETESVNGGTSETIVSYTPSTAAAADLRSGISWVAASIGAEYEFAKMSIAQSTLMLGYYFTKDIYPKYLYRNTITGNTLEFTGTGGLTNNISLGFKSLLTLHERFILGIGIRGDFRIFNEFENTRRDIGGAVTNAAETVRNLQFYFMPAAGLSIAYQWVPDRFRIYGGILADLPDYTYRKSETVLVATGQETVDKAKLWDNLKSEFTVGATLTIIPGFDIDLLIITDVFNDFIGLDSVKITAAVKK